MGTSGYHTQPVLSYPICSHITAPQQKSIFEAFFTFANNSHPHVFVNIGTDGDSVRRSVLHPFRNSTLSVDSVLYNELKDLPYLDLVTAPNSITLDFDVKHMCKRLRNNLISGSITILGVNFNKPMLKTLLISLNYSHSVINQLLNPVDKQNVPLVVKLLTVFTNEFDVDVLPPGMLNLIPIFKLFGAICTGLLAFFTDTKSQIANVLGKLSCSAHVLLFLKSSGNIYMPNVLYYDIQSSLTFCIMIYSQA